MDDSNDPLAPFMSSIDPARTPVGADLTPAQRGLLERIKTGDDHVSPNRIVGVRKWWGVGVASAVIAACVVMAFVIVPNLFMPARATALTPSPLEYSPLSQTAEQVLDMALTRLAESTGSDSPLRVADYTGWYLQVDNLPTGNARVAISPQVTNLTWSEDRSGRLTVVSGEPYWADEASGNVPPSAAPPAGEVLADVTFAVGEFDVPNADIPGSSPAELLTYLTEIGLPPDADAFTFMETTKRLLTLWTLTNEQHAALLETLLHRDDIQIVGATTDRVGRDVIGVAAEAAAGSGLQDTLLISEATGRIVGIETTRLTPLGSIPAGSVMSYTVWKDSTQ